MAVELQRLLDWKKTKCQLSAAILESVVARGKIPRRPGPTSAHHQYVLNNMTATKNLLNANLLTFPMLTLVEFLNMNKIETRIAET